MRSGYIFKLREAIFSLISLDYCDKRGIELYNYRLLFLSANKEIPTLYWYRLMKSHNRMLLSLVYSRHIKTIKLLNVYKK